MEGKYKRRKRRKEKGGRKGGKIGRDEGGVGERKIWGRGNAQRVECVWFFQDTGTPWFLRSLLGVIPCTTQE